MIRAWHIPVKVFRRCGSGRKSDPGCRKAAAYGSAVLKPPDARPRIRSRCAAHDPQRPRHRTDARGACLHARLALAQVEAAGTAARRAAQPAKASFALGFLTGQEMDWLPEAMRILRDELPNIDVTVSSQYSPELANALMRGKLDLAFLRREPQSDDLEFRVVSRGPFVAVLPSDHRLASQDTISLQEIASETFIGVSQTAPALRAVHDDFFKRSGVTITPGHEVDNLAMAMSFVASMRGVALLPAYAQNFLPWSVISRPLKGDVPTIDLVIGYSKANTSPILKLFLSRVDDLIASVSKKGY